MPLLDAPASEFGSFVILFLLTFLPLFFLMFGPQAIWARLCWRAGHWHSCPEMGAPFHN